MDDDDYVTTWVMANMHLNGMHVHCSMVNLLTRRLWRIAEYVFYDSGVQSINQTIATKIIELNWF